MAIGCVSDPHVFEGCLDNSGPDGDKLKVAYAAAESTYLPGDQFLLFHLRRKKN